jgi:hypothetical protein
MVKMHYYFDKKSSSIPPTWGKFVISSPSWGNPQVRYRAKYMYDLAGNTCRRGG